MLEAQYAGPVEWGKLPQALPIGEDFTKKVQD